MEDADGGIGFFFANSFVEDFVIGFDGFSVAFSFFGVEGFDLGCCLGCGDGNCYKGHSKRGEGREFHLATLDDVKKVCLWLGLNCTLKLVGHKHLGDIGEVAGHHEKLLGFGLEGDAEEFCH